MHTYTVMHEKNVGVKTEYAEFTYHAYITVSFILKQKFHMMTNFLHFEA